MITPATAITLNRTAFIQQMRKDSFVRYTLHKNGKDVYLVATQPNGAEFILGTASHNPRIWTDFNYPIKFLEESGVYGFNIMIEGETS